MKARSREPLKKGPKKHGSVTKRKNSCKGSNPNQFKGFAKLEAERFEFEEHYGKGLIAAGGKGVIQKKIRTWGG